MIILGVDPGSIVTGFGVIEKKNNQHKYIASGIINLKQFNWPNKLKEIFTSINEIINIYKPDVAAIEQVFVGKNASSAIKLGQARGAAITSILNNSLKLGEYSPREIKQAVVGYGGAEKIQVQKMVKILLNIQKDLSTDASDALAIAICHSFNFSKID